MATSNPFDQFDEPAAANPFDQFDKPVSKPANFIRKMADVALSVGKGVIAVPEAAVGLADIASGGRAGKAVENAGVRFKDAKGVLSGFQSDDLKAKEKEFADAEGVLDKAGVALSNPSLIVNTVAESIGPMLAGGVVGRGVAAAAPRIGAVGAGAAGEGIVGAGSAAEGVRQETDDGLLTGKQSALAAGSGAATAGFGLIGGLAARKLGIGDVDTMLAQGSRTAAGQAPKGLIRRMGEGAVAEGVLEELPQSLSEQALQNVALDKPITEGLADAGVMGVLAGGTMGAAAAGISRPGGAPAAAAPPGTDPLALPAPTITVGPDGQAQTTDQRQAEREAQIRGNIVDAASPGPGAAYEPPALPAPTITVGPTGEALTAGDRNARLNNPADITDVESRPVATPAEQMGLYPEAGPISAAAVLAVNSGVTQDLVDTAAQQAAAADAEKNKGKEPEGEGAFKTRDEASKYISTQKRAGGASIQALPIQKKDGSYGLALKDSPDYEIASFQQRQEEQRAAGVIDGDILTKAGTIWGPKQRGLAAIAAKRQGAGFEVAPVAGGFVVRKSPAKPAEATAPQAPAATKTIATEQPKGGKNAPTTEAVKDKPAAPAGQAGEVDPQKAYQQELGRIQREYENDADKPRRDAAKVKAKAQFEKATAGQKQPAPVDTKAQAAIKSVADDAKTEPARASQQPQAEAAPAQAAKAPETAAAGGAAAGEPAGAAAVEAAGVNAKKDGVRAALASGKPLAIATQGDGSIAVGPSLDASTHLPIELTKEEKKTLRLAQADLELSDTPQERAAAKKAEQDALRPAIDRALVAKPEAGVANGAEIGDFVPDAINTAASEAATSPDNDLPEPTQAQKEAGNYRKGHIKVQGLDISIENPKGSQRTGVEPGGKAWSHTMSDHYGYLKRTTGADDEQIDVYVGSKPDSDKVFVVDQIDQQTGKFDEHKVMLGFANQMGAMAAYRSNFDKGWKVGPVKAMSMDEFKTWLKDGDTRAPAAIETVAPTSKAPAPPPATDAAQTAQKWFGSKEKALDFITKRGISATHEAVLDGKRWIIEQKEPAAQSLPAQPAIDSVAETERKAAQAKVTEAENKKAAHEVERDLFREMSALPALVGKDVTEVVQALRDRLAAANATESIAGMRVVTLGRAIHKQLARTAAAIEKAKHRQPMVYQAAVDGAAEGITDVSQRERFAAGFAHAMAGKTKSTLLGDHLADQVKGYEAAQAWRKTEEGAAWFEGRPVSKLQNTGIDLRRHWEQMQANMKAGESDIDKAWKQIERATTRADLFAPLLPEGVSPGFRLYVEHARGNTATFKEWLQDTRYRWYGSVKYRSKYSDNKSSNLDYILAGNRYPDSLSAEDRQSFETDPAYRAQFLRDAAAEYLTAVRGMIGFLEGKSSVREAALAFDEAYIDATKQAEFTTRNTNYGMLNLAGDKVVSRLRGIWSGRPEGFGQMRSGSAWTETLIEKEATIALPTRADPLSPPKLDRVTREGRPDQRKGANITPAQFKATFGFADVGFGKWVGGKQDQDHLNYSYDAFMDLANHFGADPKNIGFGGNLHFTIGALGRGKASAHFWASQPHPDGGTVSVINLTNTKGDGTVYHEWAHALDHFMGGEWLSKVRPRLLKLLSTQTATAADVDAIARRFLIGGAYWSNDKKMSKVDAAIRGLSYYASRGEPTAYKSNADKLGKDYWGNEHELIARAFEAWASDTLGGTNTYLVNPAWVGDGMASPEKGHRGTPYPTGSERAMFSQVLTALSKAVKWQGGKPTVTLADFETMLPINANDGAGRRKDLSVKANMEAYRDQLVQEKADKELGIKQQQAAREQEEREEMDRIAAEKLAELADIAPPTIDPPQPDQTMGPLDEDDLSALFDQAAAELREETQEQPDVAPPPAPATAAAPTKAAKDYTGRVWVGADGKKRKVLSYQGGATATVATVGKEGTQEMTPAEIEAAIAARDTGASGAALLADKLPVVDKTAAALIADAAKLGVKGADEALKGLSALFGKPGRLNSFPGGFDEDTYQQAKPHFEAALTAFQAAGKSLKDLFKMLIQQFGDGVKEYAVRFAMDQKLTSQLGSQPSASSAIANTMVARLERGQTTDWRRLFEIADHHFGGTQGEGKYTPKDAYDALEMGINRYLMIENGRAFNPTGDAQAAQLTIAALDRVLELVPTQTKRTAEQDEFQQFSTVPPLAFAANWVANITSADTMMEPSAGLGGLAAFAKNAGAKLILNELSSRRAALLQEVFPGNKVWTENAEQLHNILPAGIVPSVVVMNPPFSASAGRMQGQRNTQIGGQHVEQGLQRLAPGGRLVAIVGDGMALDRQAFKEWWAKIGAKYDVRAVIPMDGSGYAKYGTTFDNVLLVIDKVPPSGRPIVQTKAMTYIELVNLLTEIRNDRPNANLPANDRDGFEQDAAESARLEPVPEGEGDAGAGPAAGGAAVLGEGQPPGGGSGGTRRLGGAGGKRRPTGNVLEPSSAAGNAGSGNAGGSSDAAAAPPGGSDATGVSLTATATASAVLTNSVFESYTPQRLQVAGAKPHPGPLVQSAAMASVLPPAPTYTPNLPAKTVKDGLLSIAQIEAVVYAGQAHSEFLDSKERRGFFIGDGTGVGKGREIGGIMLDNLRQGRKKAVWISEKQGLMNDAKRDFKGVGGDDSIVFNQNKTKAEDGIPDGDGIIFTTYSTLRSGALSQDVAKPLTNAQLTNAFPAGTLAKAQNRGEVLEFEITSWDAKNNVVYGEVLSTGRTGRVSMDNVLSVDGITDWRKGRPVAAAKVKKAGQSRLDQLVKWLGEDFDGVIAFDEAHNAGNAVAMKGERGSSEPSAQALAVVELQKRLPQARVVYVSATGATTVANLAYSTRLGLWGPGTAFAGVQNFIAEMTAGGLATMELVARDMKQMGAYIARSLSFEGVTYSRVEHELTPIQQDIYNRVAEGWQVTLQNIDKALEITGADKSGKAKGAAKSAYWGAQQRFFNQIITSMQMPSVIDQIEADLAAGDAVVLQLVNTNEAQQNRAIAKRKDDDESTDLEDLDLTPRDQLLQMVEKSFPIVQHEEYTDENGKKQSRPVRDSEGNPVQNAEAIALRDKLLQDLQQIRVPDGPLELILNHFGVETVAEVTGRTQRVVKKADKKGEIKAQIETRGASSARADANSFMDDKKRVLVFSDAGGTGFSFHADNTQKNQRKRKHYLIQPGWIAAKAVQGFGRTHRTNQKSAPHYYLASTNIPAQKRFLSAIARRLDQLGAMTKGQRDAANQGMFSEKDNLESKYATQAVRQFIDDLKAGRVEGIKFLDFLHQTGLADIVDKDTGSIAEDKYPTTRLFLNRMLSLTLDMQTKVFDAFIERMEQKVDIAAQRGELDSGMATIRALETTVVGDEVVYTDPRTGAETRYVELELTQPTTIYNFPIQANESKPIEWVVNIKSGKVGAKIASGTITKKDGSVVANYRIRTTGGTRYKTEDEADSGDLPSFARYRKVEESVARTLWEQENAAKPPTYKESAHMIVGAMLPIWDRLKTDGFMSVARTQTSDGKRLLGRVIEAKDVAAIRKRLNMTSAAAKLTPEQVMERILKGQVGELANGWKLKRAKVSDDLRIELAAGYVSGAVSRELTDMGVIQERIQWVDRYFVPTGKEGIRVLQALFKNKPLVDILDPRASSETPLAALTDPMDAAAFAANFGPARGMQVPAVQEIVNQLAAKWQNGPRIVVVQSVADLPTDVQARVGPKARGVYTRDAVYIVADNNTGRDSVARTLAHEVIAHEGLRGMLGQQGHIELMRRIQKGVSQGDALLMASRDYVRRAYAGANLTPKQEADEIAAHVVEMAVDPATGEFKPGYGWLKMVFAKIRNFLRSLGLDIAFTHADLQGMLVASMRNLEAGQKTQGGGELVAVAAALDDDRTVQANGVRRPIVNSEGQLLAANTFKQQAFYKWFGDSKVVDDAGKPLVVYHGTTGDVTTFNPERAGQEKTSDWGKGVYFTPSSSTADYYRGEAAKRVDTESERLWALLEAEEKKTTWSNGSPTYTAEHGRLLTEFRTSRAHAESRAGSVMPVYLSIKNPLIQEYSNLPDPFLAERAKAAGHDGIIVLNGNGGFDEIIAFRPEQIKSAIGNSGDFDPDNGDILAALGTPDRAAKLASAIKGVTVTDLIAKAGNKLADYRNLGLQLLGGRQLTDLYARDLPPLESYTRMVQQMTADANEVGATADQTATAWGKLPDDRELAELMHDATLAQIDAAKPFVPGDNRVVWGRLNAQFKALSEGARKVYIEARDGYEEHYANVREAIRDKIERSEMTKASKAAMLERMDGEFFDKIKGVYFPLARFGKYVVVTRGPDGGAVNVSRAETLNEAEATRALMLKAYPASSGYLVGKVLRDKEFNAARDAVGRGFLKELFQVLDETDIAAELQDAVNQLYLASMPDLSWAKHGIHRKGTPGFSQDARRAYAQNMFHGARYLAKLRYADQLQDKLTGMQTYVESKANSAAYDSVKAQQVVDELTKRHDSLMNPNSNPLSTALTSFGFVFHLGLSPASAMVNLSQTALVAYPIMGAKWGFDKAAAALAVASKEAATNKNDISSALNGDERRAYDEAVRSGTIDVTNAHDLAGIAQGEDSAITWKLRPVMKWASFLFHHAERFNRQITFVASYRLARGAGADHGTAYEQATRATYDGHFDYAASNRPRVMQGNTAKVLLLFKQYGQNMVYTLARQAQLSMQAETPAGRAEARKALGGLLALHAAAAGVLGLPLVGVLLSAASMLGSDDDEPWDAETALRNMLADAFGQKPAEVLARGFSRLTPWDISGRVALNKLILPDIQEGLEGQRLGEAAMAAALGPVAGIGINVLKGMQDISNGKWELGLEAMLPSALRGPMKALRYGDEGARDRTGVVIKDEVSAAGVVGQALGFAPSEVRNAAEGRSAIYQADKQLMQRRSDLMGAYAEAYARKDVNGMAAVREEIAGFNEKNPNRRIQGLNLAQSIKARAKRVAEAQGGVYLPKKRRDVLAEGRFSSVE